MNITVKIFGTDSYICRPDTTWERENRDFYPPEFVGGIYYTPVIFARISKAGKFIGSKFVSRYYDGLNFGILMYPEEMLGSRTPESIGFASLLDHSSVLPFPLYLPEVLATEGNCFVLEKDGKRIVLLPGPPNELIPMFEKSIAPYLLSLDPNGPSVIYSRTVKICGLGESGVETLVTDLEALKNPTVAPYAKTGEVHLRVTARAEDEKAAKKLVKPVVKELESRFGRAVYTTKNEVTLEEAVVRLLKKNDLTAATVESCTGGLLAGRLVNVPGVSDVFKTGFVTYSNKAKRKQVGVKKETLEKYGAVSPQTAEEMAVGGAKAAGADVVVSITGIAGPDGGREEKPVGLGSMACFVCGSVWVERFQFKGSRAKIRESAVAAALTLMRRGILEVFG